MKPFRLPSPLRLFILKTFYNNVPSHCHKIPQIYDNSPTQRHKTTSKRDTTPLQHHKITKIYDNSPQQHHKMAQIRDNPPPKRHKIISRRGKDKVRETRKAPRHNDGRLHWHGIMPGSTAGGQLYFAVEHFHRRAGHAHLSALLAPVDAERPAVHHDV